MREYDEPMIERYRPFIYHLKVALEAMPQLKSEQCVLRGLCLKSCLLIGHLHICW